MTQIFKNNMSEIMKQAWQFVRRNGYTMSEALKTAWRNFNLKAKMRKGIVKFYFQKVDGSIRQAFGTLCEAIIPSHNASSGRRPNETVQVYWDTEKSEYRCFKRANLLNIA